MNLLVEANSKRNADSLIQRFVNGLLRQNLINFQSIANEADYLGEMNGSTPNLMSEKKCWFLENLSLND